MSDPIAPGFSAPEGERAPGLPTTPEIEAILGMEAAENEDGSVDLSPPALAEGVDVRTVPWGENLAAHLPDSVLSQLATEVLDGYEADLASNAEHYATLEEGI